MIPPSLARRAAALSLLTVTVTVTSPARAESAPDPADSRFLAAQLVDGLNGMFGAHPGARATHAKGAALGALQEHDRDEDDDDHEMNDDQDRLHGNSL